MHARADNDLCFGCALVRMATSSCDPSHPFPYLQGFSSFPLLLFGREPWTIDDDSFQLKKTDSC